MRSQSFFFNSWIYRSNLRSQRSSEIDVSLVLAQKKERKKKEQAKLWTVCKGEGKKISKKSTGPGERVQFSKVKSSGVTRRPSFHLPLCSAKMGKKFLVPRANGSGYRLLYAESNWNAPRKLFAHRAALLKRPFFGILLEYLIKPPRRKIKSNSIRLMKYNSSSSALKTATILQSRVIDLDI